ncbi:MAG: methylmalonyl Co-A mutase-associated GTPase MeaB [Chthoniobacteraceae bacterium]|nr:methylmalonyl Co-A mutase-associated GTPase MeaB [Chthoniobacteraceae bacterium]
MTAEAPVFHTPASLREPDPEVVARAREIVEGVRSGSRMHLGRAITLIESNAPKHAALAEEVVRQALPYAGQSIRVGITGVPGAGKSTFIEALGCMLCREGTRVAVLAVDPSSTLSRGSVLGDKTRMEMLCREDNCFIRPSPSSGTLGGVTRKSRETIVLCEAAGYDVILVETVGVGQSETTVRSMVDFFLVLLIAGAGDELQGIKKGVIELADTILITKADGNNIPRTEAARVEFARVLHYLTPPTPGWNPKVLTCSSLEHKGIREAWEVVEGFRDFSHASGHFVENRKQQTLDWIEDMLSQQLWDDFIRNEGTRSRWPEIKRQVLEGNLSATTAVKQLFNAYTIHHD